MAQTPNATAILKLLGRLDPEQLLVALQELDRICSRVHEGSLIWLVDDGDSDDVIAIQEVINENVLV